MVLNMKTADPGRGESDVGNQSGHFCVGAPGWTILDLKARSDCYSTVCV